MVHPAINDPPTTAEAFMAWYDEQPDGRRYELFNGQIYEMQGEQATHARAKLQITNALAAAISSRNLPCEAFVDSLGIRVDETNVFEPDVFVHCGPPVAGDTVLIVNPVIVVEVLSPASQRVDVVRKFNGYFRNPAVRHYVIVDSVEGSLVHHRRTPDGRIESSHHAAGRLTLDPPGLELDLEALFEGGFGGQPAAVAYPCFRLALA